MLPGTSSEVYYSTLPPEAVNADNGNNFKRSQDWIDGNKTSRKRVKWGFVALALVAIVTALGIGLGIGLQRERKTAFSSPDTPMCVSFIIISSIVLTMQALLSSTIHLLRLSFRPIMIDICSSKVLKVLYVG